MNREIKFDYIVRNIHFNEVSHVVMTLEEIEQRQSKTPSWIWTDNCEVIAKRQHSGLKDKNGKEIYEGDIVKLLNRTHNKPQNEAVVWDNLTLSYHYSSKGRTFAIHTITGTGKFSLPEVIGNIYENPELLNQ